MPAVPWSDYLPDYFSKMKGYDITEHVTELFFDIDGYRKVRFDFYDAAADLFKESFTKQYYDWCTVNNLIMTGHFVSEDSLLLQTQSSGDVMSHYEFMHWPGVDKLLRTLDPVPEYLPDMTVAMKQVSSVVDQLDKDRAFCEAFGCVGGQVSFFHRKWIGDWMTALGISFVNHHLALYSMRGERKRDYPANLFFQQPWWADERGLADYEARSCAFATEGSRCVDILIIQPLSSVQCEYSPVHKNNEFVTEGQYDSPFALLSRKLMEKKLDYHYGNEKLMAKVAEFREASRVRVGSHSYGCVVLTPTLNLKSSTLALLEETRRTGRATHLHRVASESYRRH